MHYDIGTTLRVKNREGVVRGYIEYRNKADNKVWREYRVVGQRGEWWLSIDDEYHEYSISWPANYVKGNIGPEWHKVDEGEQIVNRFQGDVDVDPGEKASFIEYEDETKEKILSVEIWETGTEYSEGEYIELSDIQVLGVAKLSGNNKRGAKKGIIIIIASFAIVFFCMILSSLLSNDSSNNSISDFLKNNSMFTYVTSITGNENQTADVYEYNGDISPETNSTDDVTKRLISGINGNTESVTQQDDQANGTVAIVTKREYCLIYHPEDDPSKVLVQVSDRKYNYTSNQTPYKGSSVLNNWYRAHYFSSAFKADSSSYSGINSAYSMYQGDTIHNIGNGYFDSYAGSIRQSSTTTRQSSSGGISSGK